MNKFLQKLAKIFLGLSMAAGVGVAVSTSQNDAYNVSAGVSSSAATSITSGKKYLVTAVYNSTRYYLTPYNTSKSAGGISATSISNVAQATEAMCWTFTGSNNSWTIQANGFYLNNSNTNNGVSTSTSSQNWTSSFSSSNVTLTGNNSRKLALYQSSNWRCYSNSSGIQTLNLYEFSSDETTYTVTYNPNHDALANTTEEVAKNGHPSFTAPSAYTGHKFKGWKTDNDATLYTTANKDSYSVQGNVTFTAQWVDAYSVTYDANADGATGSTTDSNSPYESGDTVTVLANGFTNSGNDFVKWNTRADGNGIDYAPGATFTINSNTTLYAQWVASEWVDATMAKGATGYNYDDNTVNGEFTIKMGKSGYSGSMTITVPANATGIRFYAAAWNGKGGSSYPVTISGATVSPDSFDPVASSSLSGSGSTWTISDVSPHLVQVTLSGITSETEITLTSTERVFVWGAQYTCVVSEDPDVTLDPTSLTLILGGSSSSIEATPNEYLENAVYQWGIKSGSADCITLTNTSSSIVTVTPKGSAWSATATITLHVTSSTDQSVDINKEVLVTVQKASSLSNPFTVAEAYEAYNQSVGTTGAYISGTVVSVANYNSTYHSLSYYISDDGSTTGQLYVYSGKGLNGADFSSTNDLVAGQHVIICGNIGIHDNVVQINSNSQIKEFDSHTVTFDAGEGTVSPTSVTVTCGGTTTLPTPTRSGYTFDGWLKNNSGDPIAAGSTTDRIVADTTYVASWSMVQTLESISLSGTYTTSFPRQSTFNHDGVIVTAHYEEQGAEDKTVTSLAQFSSPDMTTTGSKTVTVTYSENEVEVSATYTITVTGIITGITTDMPANLTLDLLESSNQYSAIVQKDEGVSASVVWLSSDPTVATVSNGTITALSKVGTTTITVFADANGNSTLDEGEFSSTCSVKVVDPDALVDTLTYALIGVTGTSYSPWSGKTDATSAVYAGTTAGGNNSIQMNGSGRGIYNTASAGYIRSISVTFNSNSSTSSRNLKLYGSSTVFESISDITNGEVLGTINYSGTSGNPYVINVDSQYEFEYFGIGTNNALYIDEIVITYEKIDTTPSITLIGETSITDMEGHTDSTSLSVKVKNIDSPVFTFTYEEGGTTSLSSSYVSVQEGTPENGVYPLEIQFQNAGTSIVHIDVSGLTASFTVTVTAAVPSVLFSNPTTSVLIGSTVTNVATGENLGGATISYSSSNGNVASVDASGVVTGVEKGTVTITATATVKGIDYSDSYTLKVVDAWPFVGEYILWSEGSYTASSVTYNYKTEFGGSISDNVGTESGYTFMPKGQAVLTISAASNNGEYYISYISNGVANYLYTDTKNKLKATTDSSTEHTTWTLEEGDGGLVATNVTFKDSGKDVTLQYNPSGGNGRFACYSSTQKPTWLTPFDKTAKAGAFVENYMHVEIPTDDTGVDDNYQTCKGTGYYDVAKTQFNNLDDDVREEFATNSKFSDYYARLLDWAKANSDSFGSYGVEDYVLYLNKTVSLLSATESSGTIAIIVIISMVSVTAIGGYFFLRKRKENI